MKYSNLTNIENLHLPKIYDLESFSQSIGLSTTILYLLSKNTEDYYKIGYIPKKKKGTRMISIPSISLKLVQKWININILNKLLISDCAMAFRKGNKYGIKQNAEIHKYDSYVLRIDLKDFFGSIKRKDVFYLFYNLGYNVLISNILSNICTYYNMPLKQAKSKGVSLERVLPQGAVTSPTLSNLIFKRVDTRLEGLVSKREITYSRYADDLFFSCNNEVLLKKTQKVIYSILEDEGFKINSDKVKLMGLFTERHITGLTLVDNKVIVPRYIKRKVRAMIHYMIATSDYSNLDKVRGYISFISSIESNYIEKIKKYINSLISKEQYRIFEDIVSFYNANSLFDCDKMEKFTVCNPFMDEGDFLDERIDFFKKHNIEDRLETLGISNKEIAQDCENDNINI